MKSFTGYLYEKEDYFTGSQFGNEDGDTWNVEDVIQHAKSDPDYFHKAFPVKSIENQLSYWKNSKAQRTRMKKSDTSFPILIIKHKDGTKSVSDGLNRLKKTISIEKSDTIPAYEIPEQDIEHLKIKRKS